MDRTIDRFTTVTVVSKGCRYVVGVFVFEGITYVQVDYERIPLYDGGLSEGLGRRGQGFGCSGDRPVSRNDYRCCGSWLGLSGHEGRA